MSDRSTWVLLLSAPDRPGIVAGVSGRLAALGANIEDAEQHHDRADERFFQRIEFTVDGERDAIEAELVPVTDRFSMTWELHRVGGPVGVAVMATKARHCLADLLVRAHTSELPMTVEVVVANRPDIGELPERFGVPFVHLDPDTQDAPTHDGALEEVFRDHDVELVVLARYMRIVSPRVTAAWRGRMINIHHSFLPAFPGANPYAQAHERGVKIIGATAHYVTDELDEGPIIAQDVTPVSHRDEVSDLVALGRDLEVNVLARAVRAHLDRRVLVHGRRTIVFGR